MEQKPGTAEISRHPATRFLIERMRVNLLGALILATALSTQFLAQPFVWQYFGGDEIFEGWTLVFRDRLFVAASIALALAVAETAARRRTRGNLGYLFAALVLGAMLAEILLAWLDPQGDRSGPLALAGRTFRWVIIAGSCCTVGYFWQRSRATATEHHMAELRRLRAERLLAKLRVEALQRQIEPHFLFNTLATVRHLQRSKSADGQLLLSRFLEFLRGILDSRQDTVSRLGDEIAIAAAYLDVCAIRMGGMLRWSIDVPEPHRRILVPRFGLATLLENAVKHGIAPSPTGGTIAISTFQRGNSLELTVADTGVGFGADHGTGVGLANIAEQLALRFGDAASLSLTSNGSRGVRAMIRVPSTEAP